MPLDRSLLKDHMPFVYDDGGRVDSGKKGHAGDCVCRAVVIASQRPYSEIYNQLAHGNANERGGRGVVRDTHDPQRRTYWYGDSGTVERVSERCVYGYWRFAE